MPSSGAYGQFGWTSTRKLQSRTIAASLANVVSLDMSPDPHP